MHTVAFLTLWLLSGFGAKVIACWRKNVEINYTCSGLYVLNGADIFFNKFSKLELQYFGYKWVKIAGDHLHEESKIVADAIIMLLRCDDKRNQFAGSLPSIDRPVTVTAITYLPHIAFSKINDKPIMLGFCGHFFSIFATNLNISFRTKETTNEQYGGFKNGKWTGMIGDAVYGSADIAACICMTRQRKEVLDFSSQLYVVKPQVVYRKLDNSEWSVFFFLEPYNKIIWFCIFAMSFLIIVIRNLAEYSCKRKFYRNYACGVANDFLLCWPVVVIGNIPFSSMYSMKFLLTIYLAFSMLVLVVYSSSLTALFSNNKVKILFESLDEMVAQSDYSPVLISGSSTFEFYVKSYSAPYFEVNSIKEGIERIYSEKGKLLTTQITASRFIKRNCSFSFASKYVFSERIMVAYSKQFPYKEYFNEKILQFRESGLLTVLRERHIFVLDQCESGNLFLKIAFGQITGPSLFLVIGVLLSLVVGLLEVLIDRLKMSFSLMKEEDSFLELFSA